MHYLTKQDQIRDFVNDHISWPRPPVNVFGVVDARRLGPSLSSRPRVAPEELARELLAMAEFRALGLGTWLGTTDGQLIAEAVEMVAPPLYRQDIEVLVEALQIAARVQHEGRAKLAGLFAVGAAVGIAAITIAMATAPN